jgi:hypothetical protein
MISMCVKKLHVFGIIFIAFPGILIFSMCLSPQKFTHLERCARHSISGLRSGKILPRKGIIPIRVRLTGWVLTCFFLFLDDGHKAFGA